jgi:hypothetical protein
VNDTTYFFSGIFSGCPAIVHIMPAKSFARAGYAFAEYEAARHAIKQAFAHADWDGYGALAIGEDTKKNALGVLNYLETATHAPEVTLNPNGTLSFEWDTSQGCGQLEIGRTRYSFYVKPTGGSPYVDEGEVNEVKPTVGWLLDAVLYPKPSSPVTARVR